MSLLRFDLRQSRLIPFVAIALLMTKMTFAFFAMEMFMASYAAQAGMLLAFVIGLLLVIRDKTLHTYDLLVFGFVLLLEAITLLNGNDWKNWFYTGLTISTYLFLFNYYHEKYHVILLGILFVLSVAIYCQLGQCILHPEKWMVSDDKELGKYLLGGNYNQMGIRMIIALVIGIWSTRFGKWLKVNLAMLIISCFAILFMVRSMTSLSCMFLFLFFCVIRNRKLLGLGLTVLFVCAILFEVIVCFSGTGLQNNELASWFIKDVLGKDMTFTGRTYMWDAALHVIAKSPLWGNGFVDTDWYMANMTTLAIGAHNYILNTMVYGGVTLLTIYLIMVISSIWHLVNLKDINSMRLLAAFGVLTIMMLFEVYETSLVFLLLTIMYYYPSEKSLETVAANEREQ